LSIVLTDQASLPVAASIATKRPSSVPTMILPFQAARPRVSMPQQMLMYRSAAWFVRAYAPELAMGLHTVEESSDVEDAPKVATFKKNPSALADMRANNPQDA
jgi:hypothetical protein